MAQNTEDISKTKCPSGMKETNDYVDLNNGILYNILAGKKLDSCTIEFYTQPTFDQLSKLLQAQYKFKKTANGTANVATTAAEARKVVLTLYTTKKLVIQGSGAWTWRNTVFRGLSSQLSITGSKTCSTDSNSIPPRQTENTTDTSSPTTLLNKVWNRIKSPRSASTPRSSSPNQTKQVSAKKTKTTKHDAIKSTPKSNHSTIEIDSEDEITCVKQLYISTDNDTSQNQQKITKDTDPTALNKIKADLEKYKKANKELQESSRKLLNETKTLKQDHEKVMKALETKNKEVTSLKSKQKSYVKIQQEKEQTIKQLKEKLASVSAERLIFEEHNNKLKTDIKTLQSEKSELVGKLAQRTGNVDTIEHKIESEIGELREALMTEILQIKEQVKKSTDIQSQMSSDPSTLQKNKDTTKKSQHTNHSGVRPAAPINQLSLSKSVFIAGDDMTSNLSSRIMSSNCMSVKIKTHREGRISTIENSLVKLAEENRSYLTNLDAVILHAGAGNISDADSTDSIVSGLKDAAETVHNVNPETRIAISSILPRRNDRLTNTVITQTNQALMEVCKERDYMFIDNDKVFLKDGRPDVSLYRDPLHLNKKGGKIFGQNIQATLTKILQIPQGETQQFPERQREAKTQDFRFPPNHRIPQGETLQYPVRQGEATQFQTQDFRFPPNHQQGNQQNRMIPQFMPFYPPWFPAPPQQFLQGWK